MRGEKESKPVCRSVFRSGKDAPLKIQFTRKWLEWVNRMEKNKTVAFK